MGGGGICGNFFTPDEIIGVMSETIQDGMRQERMGRDKIEWSRVEDDVRDGSAGKD